MNKKSFNVFHKTPLIVANWKMNLLLKSTEELLIALKKSVGHLKQKGRVVICPSFVYMDRASQILAGSALALGAQDLFWETEGNYTSQVSAKMLVEFDCRYVIIGHSERRKYAGETDESVDRKTVTAVRNGLKPIVCVGENMEQRRQRVQHLVVSDQVKKALRYVNPIFAREEVIICYEPVWSIYPGQPCEPSQAKEMSQVIRQALIDLYPESVVENNFTLIYGGSVTPENVKDYVDKESLHGVLVGTSSLVVDKFTKIIKKTFSPVKTKEK